MDVCAKRLGLGKDFREQSINDIKRGDLLMTPTN